MSVSFSSNLTGNQQLAFQGRHEKKSHSYVSSTIVGAAAYGAVGAGVGAAVKGLANMNVSENRKILSGISKAASSISGKTPIRRFMSIGAIAGAIAMIYDTYKHKNEDAKIQKLRLMS